MPILCASQFQEIFIIQGKKQLFMPCCKQTDTSGLPTSFTAAHILGTNWAVILQKIIWYECWADHYQMYWVASTTVCQILVISSRYLYMYLTQDSFTNTRCCLYSERKTIKVINNHPMYKSSSLSRSNFYVVKHIELNKNMLS